MCCVFLHCKDDVININKVAFMVHIVVLFAHSSIFAIVGTVFINEKKESPTNRQLLLFV